MPRLRVSIASDRPKRMCPKHPTVPATATRITTTTRKLKGVPPQTVRRPECSECAKRPLASGVSIQEKIVHQ